VRYECNAAAEDIQMFRCHCRVCQRLTGGPYAAVVFMPAGAFRLTRGELRRHAFSSELGGTNTRGFCPQCGARMTGGEAPDSPGIGVMAASLDDPSWFAPTFDMWMCDAQQWDALDPTTTHFAKYPPES
jgi:hypothetical protein